MLEYSKQPSSQIFLVHFEVGELTFFPVTYCLWKSLMATAGLLPIPNLPLSIITLQSLHVQSTGYSKLLWDNIGKIVVTCLVPWATPTFECVVKPGTISFIRINACDWDRLWDDHSRAPKWLPHSLARHKQGEWHGPCPYAAALYGGCSHEGVADTQLCQVALLSKPRVDIHKELHPWVNNRRSEDKHPWALTFDTPRGFRSLFWWLGQCSTSLYCKKSTLVLQEQGYAIKNILMLPLPSRVRLERQFTQK